MPFTSGKIAGNGPFIVDPNITIIDGIYILIVNHKRELKLYVVGNTSPINQDLNEILEILKNELSEKEYLKYEQSAFENFS